MKELSLLMFVVACGYVLGRFLNRFAAGASRGIFTIYENFVIF